MNGRKRVCQMSTQQRDQLSKLTVPCRKGIGRNSIRYTWCKLWTHKKCSNIKGRLTGKIVFVSRRCTGAINTKNLQKTDSITCHGKLEVVDSFHYLGDQISCWGGYSGTIAARIRTGWAKFRELLPLLVTKGLSLKVKARQYDACV
uniref:Uncharacterized protein n=1 Tax=Octopus bimaculoides TaxID=37653 RepID=A0A0L8H7Z9_OCTBM